MVVLLAGFFGLPACGPNPATDSQVDIVETDADRRDRGIQQIELEAQVEVIEGEIARLDADIPVLEEAVARTQAAAEQADAAVAIASAPEQAVLQREAEAARATQDQAEQALDGAYEARAAEEAELASIVARLEELAREDAPTGSRPDTGSGASSDGAGRPATATGSTTGGDDEDCPDSSSSTSTTADSGCGTIMDVAVRLGGCGGGLPPVGKGPSSEPGPEMAVTRGGAYVKGQAAGAYGCMNGAQPHNYEEVLSLIKQLKGAAVTYPFEQLQFVVFTFFGEDLPLLAAGVKDLGVALDPRLDIRLDRFVSANAQLQEASEVTGGLSRSTVQGASAAREVVESLGVSQKVQLPTAVIQTMEPTFVGTVTPADIALIRPSVMRLLPAQSLLQAGLEPKSFAASQLSATQNRALGFPDFPPPTAHRPLSPGANPAETAATMTSDSPSTSITTGSTSGTSTPSASTSTPTSTSTSGAGTTSTTTTTSTTRSTITTTTATTATTTTTAGVGSSTEPSFILIQPPSSLVLIPLPPTSLRIPTTSIGLSTTVITPRPATSTPPSGG
ncbi:MAG: hypothetical protein R2761_06530 [Acidimicrobiales bacterium]